MYRLPLTDAVGHHDTTEATTETIDGAAAGATGDAPSISAGFTPPVGGS